MELPDDPVVTSRTIQQKFAPHMHNVWMRSRSGLRFVPLVELALDWKAQFIEEGWA
jgi:hypothetical protein